MNLHFSDSVSLTKTVTIFRDIFELEESTYNKPIPAHIYRVVVHPVVTLSPNDRAYQVLTVVLFSTISRFESLIFHSV